MENEVLLTTPEVAARLEITLPRVHQLIKDGRLPSKQFGRTHVISEADLIAFKAIDRKPGRPPKPKDEGEPANDAKEATAEATGNTNGHPVTPATEPAKRKPKAAAAQKVTKPKQKAKKAKAS